MTILYIHGLNGSLSQEKRDILETYGNVLSPSIDYNNNVNSIIDLHSSHQQTAINVIIGSSMGGFAAYHLSKLYKLPCLIFNPALAQRSVHQLIPETPKSSENLTHIVLGSKDPIVQPKGTLEFLGNLLYQPQDYTISIRHDLAHRIPLSVFKEEVSKFMEKL